MNPKRLFVGNLTYSVNEKQLWNLFSRYGEVVGVRIIEGKGYGFVEMESYEDARAVRSALNETEFYGRKLLIDDVRPPTSRMKSSQKGRGAHTHKRARGASRAVSQRTHVSPEKRRKVNRRSHEGDYVAKERKLNAVPRPHHMAGERAPEETGRGISVSNKNAYPKKKKNRFWPGGISDIHQ